MYKIANKIAPKYLNDLFQIRNINANDTTSNLRSVSNINFIIPKPNINLFKSSISYSDTIIWSSIALEIKNADSINSFVNRCVAWIKNWITILSTPPLSQYQYTDYKITAKALILGQTDHRKRCGPRSDATECDVWLGSTLIDTRPAIF